jgi:hypothetical protein
MHSYPSLSRLNCVLSPSTLELHFIAHSVVWIILLTISTIQPCIVRFQLRSCCSKGIRFGKIVDFFLSYKSYPLVISYWAQLLLQNAASEFIQNDGETEKEFSKSFTRSLTRYLTNYHPCCSFERINRKKFIIVSGHSELFKAPSEKVVEETVGVMV